MRRIAGLLAAAVLFAEIPVQTCAAQPGAGAGTGKTELAAAEAIPGGIETESAETGTHEGNKAETGEKSGTEPGTEEKTESGEAEPGTEENTENGEAEPETEESTGNSGAEQETEENTESGETEPETEENTESGGAENETEEMSTENGDNSETESEEETTTEEAVTEEAASEEAALEETTKKEEYGISSESSGNRIRYLLGREMTEEEIAAQKALEPAYLPEMEVFELPEKSRSRIGILSVDGKNTVSYEERYDSREKGILTPVKAQKSWNTCWAFSALGLMESSLIGQGLRTQEEIDLSEWHLAYVVGHTGYDALGNAAGDTITVSPESQYLSRGGNIYYAMMRLMNWQGAAAEEEFPYSYASAAPEDFAQENAQKAEAHLTNCYLIPGKPNDRATIQTIKGLVKEYGGVAWSYYNASRYYNYSTCGYYNYAGSSTNHAIVIVGWDDTYARENFGTEEEEASRPASDGAWIVRNSWGEAWGDGGYFYISYEDATLGAGNAAAVLEAAPAYDYDNNYFYGNTAVYKGKSMRKAAQVFTVSGQKSEQEMLKAVSFMIYSSDVKYQIQIYKNPELTEGVVTNPESGTPVFAVMPEGTTTYSGLYTVNLPEPVLLDAGERFSVVLYFPDASSTMYVDGTKTENSSWQEVNSTQAGESFSGETLSGGWTDLHTSGLSIRMNALTKDVSLKVSPLDYKTIRAEWLPVEEAASYTVTVGNGERTIEIHCTENELVFDMEELPGFKTGENYRISVLAINGKEAVIKSMDEVYFHTVPDKLEATAYYQNDEAELNWTGGNGADAVQIYRSTKQEERGELLAEETLESGFFTDDALPKDGIYYYRLVPVVTNSAGESICGTEGVTEIQVKLTVQGTLTVSPANMVVSKGNTVPFQLSLSPENLYYNEPFVWTAEDEEGALAVEEKAGAVLVKGRDSKEILRIANGNLYATGSSENKRVKLHVSKGGMEAACEVLVNVPVTKLKFQVLELNDAPADSFDTLKTGDRVVLGVSYEPDNADDTIVKWTTSNSKVVALEERDASSLTLYAKGSGICMLRAYTADGVSVSREITVEKAETLYGIWISDRDLTGTRAEKEKDGTFRAAGAENIPVYDLQTKAGEENGQTFVQAAAYVLREEDTERNGDEVTGGTLQKASSFVVFRSADPTVAEVTKDGRITAAAAGETEIYALDSAGNTVYGKCLVRVCGEAEETQSPQDYPVDKAYKLSAVTSSLYMENYALDAKSACKLQVKNQYGEVLDASLFQFTSAKPSVCMVDENGTVMPNPGFTSSKNAAVKITAALKGDKAKRKVVFRVTVLAKRQTDRIELEQLVSKEGVQEAVKAEQPLEKIYEAGDCFTFRAKGYDSSGAEMETLSLSWKVSDSSMASLKVNKDKTVTVTVKKAGRFRVICEVKDSFKRTASVEIAEVTTAPVVNKKTVAVNKYTASEEGRKLSESFQAEAPDGAVIGSMRIVSVKAGKNKPAEEIVQQSFSVVKNEDYSYSIAVEYENFLKNVKNNTVYELTLEAEINGIAVGNQTTAKERFTMKLKVISKEPSVTVKAEAINRIYTKEADLSGLLTVRAPGSVTAVEVLTAKEGQINGFEQYFAAVQKKGRWYLKFKDTANNKKTSLKGKLRLTVEGYEPVVKTITVSTKMVKPIIKQQTVPSIHMAYDAQAEIPLYNQTAKSAFDSFRITEADSESLEIREEEGVLQVKVKEGAKPKNGEVLTAAIKVMATKGRTDHWREAVSLKIRVKVYTTKAPAVSIKNNTLLLNRQTAGETAETLLTRNCQNISLHSVSEWKIAGEKNTDWLELSYDEQENKLTAGFKEKKMPAAGTYKIRLSNMIEGFEAVTKTLTVKVIDKAPTAVVKMSGKLDLVNRSQMTLSGKITLKNSASEAKKVTVLTEDGTQENPYYTAEAVENGRFLVKLTEEGRNAALTTKKTTLPVRIELENGTEIASQMTFKPTQSTPQIAVPKTQTVYKSLENLTRDYDMTGIKTAGVKIKRLEAVSVPRGIGVVTKEGHVLVTLNDRGIKPGNYKIKVQIYLEGAQALAGSPDGKPITKVITVKVV